MCVILSIGAILIWEIFCYGYYINVRRFHVEFQDMLLCAALDFRVICLILQHNIWSPLWIFLLVKFSLKTWARRPDSTVMRLPWICDRSYTAQNDVRQHFQIISEDMDVPIILPLHVLSFILRSIAFFKEFELVRKFFKRATKRWKMLCDHALQIHTK